MFSRGSRGTGSLTEGSHTSARLWGASWRYPEVRTKGIHIRGWSIHSGHLYPREESQRTLGCSVQEDGSWGTQETTDVAAGSSLELAGMSVCAVRLRMFKGRAWSSLPVYSVPPPHPSGRCRPHIGRISISHLLCLSHVCRLWKQQHAQRGVPSPCRARSIHHET